MPRTTATGKSKQAAREGARKEAAQKVARQKQPGKSSAAASGSRGRGRKRVESSDESEGSGDDEDRPPAKKNRVTRTRASEDEALEEEGFVMTGEKAGEGGDGEDGESEVDAVGEMTDEELIGALSKRWTSCVYAFFKADVKIEATDEGRKYLAFRCASKHCRIGTPVRRYLDKGDRSCGNLFKHARTCWGDEAVDQAQELGDVTRVRGTLVADILKNGAITEYFAPTKKGAPTYSSRPLTRVQIRFEFARWVAESYRPFAIATDPGFLRLMKIGRPTLYIPSPTTISRDVKVIFVGARGDLSVMLQNYPGRLHFATDAWTSPNHRAFVAFTVHLEVKGSGLAVLLDIVELAKSHSGVNLAEAFADMLTDLGLEDKIMNVTCDNASNNDTMVEHMGVLLPAFEGQFHRTRCFGHIINLVVKSLLRQFDSKKVTEAEGEADEDVRELLELVENLAEEDAATLAELRAQEGIEAPSEDEEEDDEWVDEIDSLSPEEQAEFFENVKPVKLLLAKIRKLAFKVVNSTTLLLPAWRDLCKELGLPDRLIPRDVRTRWNSTYDMAVVTVQYKKVYQRLTADGELGLRGFELTKREWTILGQLRDVLKIFKDTTLFFSRGSPNLAAVIPAMDLIDTHLGNAARSDSLDEAIRTSAGIAKRTMNRWYKLSDMSATYRIALAMHPRHKLRYFEKAGWPKSWIQEVREMVRDEYDKHYRHLANSSHADSAARDSDIELLDDDNDDNDTQPTLGKSHGGLDDAAATTNLFDILEASDDLQGGDKSDEVADYFSSPPEPCSDPIKYWSARTSSVPGLARMGLDYATIPATSIDVERTFSRGRLLLSHVRSRLSAQTTRALLCVGEWSRLDLLREENLKPAAALPDIEGDVEYEMKEGWERVKKSLDARK